MSEQRHLGASGITVSPVGMGTWGWADMFAIRARAARDHAAIRATFDASVAAGITLFDTAEIYGRGETERLLGAFAPSASRPITVISKFTPLPNRFSARALHRALDRTLARLAMPSVDLYLIHWPYTLIPIGALLDALVEATRSGKARAVGVSNFRAEQMRRAHDRLARYGVPLAANEVQYSVLARGPETNGVLAACEDLDVALIAYSPLAHGLLTDARATGAPLRVGGVSRFLPAYRPAQLRAMQPALATVRAIGRTRDKTVSQVALNWLLQKSDRVIPIPGATRPAHARSNAGALGWRLSDEEMAMIDRVSAIASR